MTVLFAAGTVFGALGVMLTFSFVIAVLVWIAKHGVRSLLADPKRFFTQLLIDRVEDIKSGTGKDDTLAVVEAVKADDWAVWEAELAGEKGIQRSIRRMERSDS